MSSFHIGEFGSTPDSPLGHIDFDRMLKDKLVRARAEMKKHSLGAIICLNEANVAYSSNLPPTFPGGVIGGNRYSILPVEGEPVGFDECNTAFVLRNQLKNVRVEYSVPAWGGPFLASALGAQDYLMKEFADQMYTILKEYKLHKEKIGIDSYIPPMIEALKKAGLDVTYDGAKALLDARTIKTPMELECIRSLASVIDGCFATMARTLRVGISEYEVWAKCVGFAIENGLSVNGGFIASGPHTWPKDNSRQASSRRMRPGDIVYADFFSFGFFGYRSCCYRTFSIGKTSRGVHETYARVYGWLKDAEKTVRPGATTKDIVQNWPEDTALWAKKPPFINSPKERLSTFWMNMGHAIGLSLYEPPFFWAPVANKWPQPIHKDTAIALETLDATPDGRAGVRLEDMIIVTEGGHEVVSRWPVEEITEVPLY